MFNPKFPYDGNQLILTSDRIMAHSKNDGIFLFGNKMIALSSIQTINLDANEKILLDNALKLIGKFVYPTPIYDVIRKK